MNAADQPRLGLAETIERLGAMTQFVEAAIASVPRDEMAFQPAPDRFSLLEHACHLRDLEREGYLVRIRRMLTEPGPTLESFDGAAVATARAYMLQDGRAAAHEFAAARHESMRLIGTLADADLAREATFAGKRVSFGDLLAMMVEHDREHRQEIEALRGEMEAD